MCPGRDHGDVLLAADGCDPPLALLLIVQLGHYSGAYAARHFGQPHMAANLIYSLHEWIGQKCRQTACLPLKGSSQKVESPKRKSGSELMASPVFFGFISV